MNRFYTQRKAPNLGRLVRGFNASYYCYFFHVDSSWVTKSIL